jgi:O-antigen ligase
MLLGLLALCIAFLVPGHYPPWAAFQNELLAAFGVAVCGAVAFSKERELHWPWLALLAVAVAAVPVLQVATGAILFSSDGILAALYLIGFGLSVAVGAALARSHRDDLLDGLAGVFLAASIASVGLAIAQWLQLPAESLWRTAQRPGWRPYANIGQANHLATLLMLGLVGGAWLFQIRRIGAATMVLTTGFLLFGVAMTQSRTAWLEAACLAIWLIAMRRRASIRIGRGAVIAACGFLALLGAVWPALSNALFLSAGRSLEEQVTGGPRLKFWVAMIDAIQREPWVGYGWNQVVLAHDRVANDQPAIGYFFEHSHNLVLDLLLWNGVPLGLLVAGALGLWFWRAGVRCREPAATLFLGAVGVVFLHSLVEFPLDFAYFLLPVGVMMGAVEFINGPNSGVAVPRWLTLALGAGAVGLTALIAWEYLQVEDDYRRMRLEAARVGRFAEPADPPSSLGILTQPQEFIRFAKTSARRDMPPEGLIWMRNVVDRQPQPPALMRYALAAALNHQPEEARFALVRLCRMNQPPVCEEAKRTWHEMTEGQFPELAQVPFP